MQTRKLVRRPYPSDLTIRQFTLIAPHLVTRPKRTGRPRANDKDVVDGVLYVLSTGCRWRDLPHDYGVSYVTCYRHFRRWIETGKLNALFEFLKGEANRRHYLHWRNAYLDASVVKSKKGANGIAVSRANTR